MAEIRENIERVILRISGLLLFVIVWEAAPKFGWIDAQFVPTFTVTLKALIKLFTVNNLYMHIMSSLWRVLAGLLISSAIAIPSGFVLGRWFLPFYEALEPLLRIFTKVNPFSLMPVFILLFGIGERIRIAVVVWVCIWPVLFGTVNGVRTLDNALVKMALSMKARPGELIFKVLLPGSMHSVFNGLRIGVEMSFFILIAGEMLGANSGLGVIIHNSNHYFNMPRLYAGALTVVLLGVLLNGFLKYLQNGIFFWKEPVHLFGKTKAGKAPVRIGKAEITVTAVIFALILVIGFQQVQKADAIARDPTQSLTQDAGY